MLTGESITVNSVPYGSTSSTTTAFMAGTCAIKVVLLESSEKSPNTATWTQTQINNVKQQISLGVSWWEEMWKKQGYMGELKFVLDFEFADNPYLVDVEPLENNHSILTSIAADFLRDAGYTIRYENFYTVDSTMHQYDDAIRKENNADWAFTLFVENGIKFTNGYSGFAYLGGPYANLTYANGNWGINGFQMCLAHEMGHIFGAQDEYLASATSYYEYGGYLGVQNTNAEYDRPASAGASQSSIMLGMKAVYNSYTSPVSTLEQLGWRDTDGDGIIDILDQPFDEKDIVSEYNVSSNIFTIGGSFSVTAMKASSASGIYPENTAITLNTIDYLQYRFDGGKWINFNNTAWKVNSTQLDDVQISITPGISKVEWRVVDEDFTPLDKKGKDTDVSKIYSYTGLVWPDVTFTQLAVNGSDSPGELIGGDSVTANFTIENKGNGDAMPFDIKWQLNNLSGIYSVSGVAAGSTITGAINLGICQSDTYTLTLTADSGNVLFETDAKNNKISSIFSITPSNIDYISNASVSIDGNKTVFKWDTAKPSQEVTGYFLVIDGYRYDVGLNNTYTIDTHSVGKFSFYVQAYNDSGGRSQPGTPVEYEVFDSIAPTLEGTASEKSKGYFASLSWNAASDDTAVTGYKIIFDGNLIDVGNTLSYELELAPGVHKWSYAAYDAAGNISAFSTERELIIQPDISAPTDPIAEKPLVLQNLVKLSWSASSDDNPFEYEVVINDTVYATKNTSISMILPEAVYSWSVSAYDIAGNYSAISHGVNFTIDITAPDAPTALFNVQKRDTIYFSWKESNDAFTNVSYELAIINKNTSAPLLTINTAETSFSTNTLAKGDYIWTVKAIDEAGNVSVSDSANLSVAQFVPDFTAPLLFGNIIISVKGQTANFVWNPAYDNLGVAGYKIEINDAIYETSATKFSIDLTDGNYKCRLAAYDIAENETWSSIQTFSIGVPQNTSNISGTITKDKVRLSWTNTLPKAKTDKDSYEILIDGNIYKSSKTSFTTQSLAYGEHTFSVRLIRNGAALNWSDSIIINVPDFTPPKMTSASVSVDGYSATLQWNDAKDVSKIVKYVANCCDTTLKTDGNSIIFENLAAGKHSASIVAYDEAGNASKAKTVKFTVKDITPPSKVDSLSFVQSAAGKGLLNWGTTDDNVGTTKYEVSIDGGKAKTVSASKLSLALSKLSAGIHTAQVRALDKAKNAGEWSDVFSFEILDVTPPAKISASAKSANGDILISWKTPKDDVGVTSYEMDIFKDGAKFGDSLTFGADTTSYDFANLSSGSYEFSLRAFDAAGNASQNTILKANISGKSLGNF